MAIRLAGSGRSSASVQRQEGRVAAAGQLLEGAVVQLGQQLCDGHVELGQAEEAPVAQPRQDPALDDLHADFHLGLVARAAWPSREHRHVVVRRELLDQPTGDGVVAVGPGDQCPGLIGHDQAGHAADELQRVDDGADPVGGGLRGRSAGVGVVRRAQHRHEDLGAADLAGGGVHDGHGLAGVVHEQLLAGDVGLAHRALQTGGPGAVLHAVGGVLVGQVVAPLVLLPQQLQRDAGAAQFLVDVGEVGLEVARGARHGRAVHPGLELLIGQALGYGPVHASHARHADDGADGGLGDAQHTRALAQAQAGFEVETKGLSQLTHGDPGCGHVRSTNRPACPRFRSPARVATVRHHAETLSAISVKRCPPWL
jgi:hypothetical protein